MHPQTTYHGLFPFQDVNSPPFRPGVKHLGFAIRDVIVGLLLLPLHPFPLLSLPCALPPGPQSRQDDPRVPACEGPPRAERDHAEREGADAYEAQDEGQGPAGGEECRGW